jgi:hypothetical protein
MWLADRDLRAPCDHREEIAPAVLLFALVQLHEPAMRDVSDSQEKWLRRCPYPQQLSNFECKLPNRSEMSRTFLLKEFEQFCFGYPVS